MVRMGDASEAKWLIDNVNGNIPQGLTTPINIKLTTPVGSGGKGGKGGWGWGPPYPMMNPMMMQQQLMMMMKGKGKGGGLSDFPPEKKVWVGGIPESVTF